MGQKGTTPPLISISGVLQNVDSFQKLIDSLTFENLKVLPSLPWILAAKGIAWGDKISGETFWSIENYCVEFEQQNKCNPKLILTTPLDRLALAEFSGLKMRPYFDRIIPSFVKDCDLFCYRPYDNSLTNIESEIDERMKCYIMATELPVQVVVGNEDQQIKTIHECLKLRFVGAIKDV